MAVGARGTYTDTGIQKRSLSDLIDMIDFIEAPLLKWFGIRNQDKFRLINWPRTKYEWIEDTMPARSTTVNNSGVVAAGATSFVVTDASIFKEGDLIGITTSGTTEVMAVASVNTSTNTLDVTGGRGYGDDSTAVEHADSSTVFLVASARLEGADYDTGYTTTTTQPYNYTQIFEEAVKVTGSEMVDQKYGITDTMAYHIGKLFTDGGKAGKLPLDLQNTFYYGSRAAGSATTPRAMRGARHYISSNITTLSSTPLMTDDIHDLMQTIIGYGGMPDTILTSPWGQRKLTSLFEDKYWTERTVDIGGPVPIKSVQTDFGVLDVLWERNCPADHLFLLEKDKVGWVEYRPFKVFDREPDGDYFIKEVIGEYGFVLKTEKAHGLVKGFSTSR